MFSALIHSLDSALLSFTPTCTGHSSTKTKTLGWDTASSSAIPSPNPVVRGDPIAFGTSLSSLPLTTTVTWTNGVGQHHGNGDYHGITATTETETPPEEGSGLNGNGIEEEVSNDAQGALWVNPWDLSAVATAMHRALLMPEAEKVVRHR